MSQMRSTYSNYHDAESSDPGTPLLIASPVHPNKSYLSHISYVSVALCELSLDIGESKIYLNDLTTRIKDLITHIHQEYEIQNVLLDYFSKERNVLEILENMDESGLLELHEDYVTISVDQLDFLKINVLDYFA